MKPYPLPACAGNSCIQGHSVCKTPEQCIYVRNTHRVFISNEHAAGESVYLEQESRHRLGGGNVFLTELTEVPSRAGYLLWIGVCFVALALGYAVML